MYNFRKLISKAILAGLLPMTTAFADLSFFLDQSFNFTKTSATIENLDHGKFSGTQATTGWKETRNLTTYLIAPEVVWIDSKRTNIYVKLQGNYGWVTDGQFYNYPLRWDIDGDTKGFDIESGYLKKVNDRFTLIPFVGFEYTVNDTKIKHQHFVHTSPDSFISQNGTKTRTDLWFPYIGIEIDFNTPLWCNQNLQYSISYQIGYGGGHGRDRVHHTIITDNPSTSRFGSHIKYEDMISHDFEVAAFYNVGKGWLIGLEFDYNTTYNTKKLPLKYKHNREIVKAGQFTPSQYHRVSETISQTYSVILSAIYNFSGESGVVVK